MGVADMVEDEVNDFLEHFGVKGMQWGVRRAASATGRGAARASKATGRGIKRGAQYANQHRRGTAEVIAAVGIAAASATIARRGTMSLSSANTMANQRSGQLLSDVGRRFVNDRTESEVITNFGRQVREGLISPDAFRQRGYL